MRTELVLHAFKADEGDWRQVEAPRRAESTPYVGRAVVAPPRNGRVMRKSGGTLVVGELACVYGLTVRRWQAEPPPFRVPPAAHGWLGILGEQRLDLRAHDAEVVGVGRQ